MKNKISIVRLIFIIVFITLKFTVNVHAETIYHVRAGAVGENNGSDWTNAYRSLPATLVRGATYYIANGNYPSYRGNPISGTDPIIIKKATINEHGKGAGWNNSFEGQAFFNTSFDITSEFVTLDGSFRKSDWRSGYGIKIKTEYQNRRSKSMRIEASNITVRHVEIEGSGPDDNDGSNDLIYIVGNYTNLKFQNCYFQYSGRTHLLIRNAPDGLIEHSYFYKNESTSAQHSQSISALNVNNWVARYNIWDTIEGTGVLTIGDGGGWKVYRNIFYNFKSASNGIFGGWTNSPMNGGEFYNNTIIDSNYARVGFSNDTNIIIKNNIFYNNIRNLFGGSGIRSHNAFGPGACESFGSEIQIGISSSIFLNYNEKNYRLTSHTNPGDKTIGNEYITDMDGRIVSDELWDRGAYQFKNELINIPVAPSGLKVM